MTEQFYLIDSYNYTKREMEILYGPVPEDITYGELDKLYEKANSKYDDWRNVYRLINRCGEYWQIIESRNRRRHKKDVHAD